MSTEREQTQIVTPDQIVSSNSRFHRANTAPAKALPSARSQRIPDENPVRITPVPTNKKPLITRSARYAMWGWLCGVCGSFVAQELLPLLF